MAVKEILADIIEAFHPDKFDLFFREKSRTYRPVGETLNQYNIAPFADGVKSGEMTLSDDNEFIVCTFKINKTLNERSGKKDQYSLGKKILKDYQRYAGGFFIFYDEKGDFRFSLIYDIPQPDGKRDWSNFRRYTYFVSRDQTNKTFRQRMAEADFSTLDSIIEAFSVEKVTKQFYQEIASWYFWAQEGDKIKYPDDFKYNDDPVKDKEQRNALNLIRLITRIIFIWFLRQKKLINPALFDKNALQTIVKNFMVNLNVSNYYNAIMQNLFFATLNQKIEEREFATEGQIEDNRAQYGVKNLFRYAGKFLINREQVLKLFEDIPFLNGGLFDCLDKPNDKGCVVYIDGFSRNSHKQAVLPDYLFFLEDETPVDLKGFGLTGKRRVRGLFEILNSYNFTIDENTPVDQEVALDPELLGKVFENLLASYNPETATTARKATGSYYTPRPIVDYMVEQSLKECLKTKLSAEIENFESRLNDLFSYESEYNPYSMEESKKIITAIHGLKILDPACGSGAFPMGILHRLVQVLHKLDPENKEWYEIQYHKAIAETEEAFRIGNKTEREIRLQEINEVFDQNINEPDYARKLYLIENCIYGVDIQPIAVQIAKLRFFISLVIDQKVDKTKPNFGVLSLPNLETKFVAANTLIPLRKTGQMTFKNPDVQKKEDELKAIRHKYFEAKTRPEKLGYQRQDKKVREELADLLVKHGWDIESAQQIAKHDLYDQNIHAEWFDPEWMFGIGNKFDIVIGNPPYGFRNVLSAEEKQFFRKKMNIEFPSGDIVELFIIISLQKLVKDNGVLTFIIPKKSLYGESWSNVRQIWISNDLSFLMDASQAFENVLLEQNAFSFKKRKHGKRKIAVGTLDQESNIVKVFGEFPLTDIFTTDLRNAQIYRGLYPSALLKKIVENAMPDTSSLIKSEIGISNITPHLTFESYGNYPCVKGIDIVRYGLKPNVRYLKGKIARKYIGLYNNEKIIGQKIIAHIQNPYPHILITLFLDDKSRLFNDTCVEIKVLDMRLRKKFLLGYLQSEFCNWYAYNFVYNRAVRTMDFINYYVTQIPIPKCVIEDLEQQVPIIEIVDRILAAKRENPQADTSESEREIDQLVYELYELTEEEIAVVEGRKV